MHQRPYSAVTLAHMVFKHNYSWQDRRIIAAECQRRSLVSPFTGSTQNSDTTSAWCLGSNRRAA